MSVAPMDLQSQTRSGGVYGRFLDFVSRLHARSSPNDPAQFLTYGSDCGSIARPMDCSKHRFSAASRAISIHTFSPARPSPNPSLFLSPIRLASLQVICRRFANPEPQVSLTARPSSSGTHQKPWAPFLSAHLMVSAAASREMRLSRLAAALKAKTSGPLPLRPVCRP